MFDLLRSDLFRLVRRTMPRALLLILAITVGALYLLMWAAAQTPQFSAEERADLLDSLRLGTVLESGLGFVGLFGALFVIILASSAIATEFDWGTIRALMPRGSGRIAFLTAKLIVLSLFAALVVIVGFLAALLASLGVTIAEGMDRDLGSGFARELLFGFGRTWFAMVPYLALAFLVALWTKSSAAGISVGAATLFLEGQLLSLVSAAGGMLERLPEAFLSINVQAILSLNGAGVRDAGLPHPWQAAAVLTAYIAAFIALAFWRFRTRDITIG